MAYTDEGGAGVGGWLAFFTLAMGVFSPLAVLASTVGLFWDSPTAPDFVPILNRIRLLELLLGGTQIAICWFVVWRLFKVQVWTTVRITIAGIWLAGPLFTIVDVLGVSLIAGTPISAMLAAGGAQAVRPFVFAGIWSAYFLMSRRVANTYPRKALADAEEVAEVFG